MNDDAGHMRDGAPVTPAPPQVAVTPQPGTWQSVRTHAGWHLRLVGANGEPILVSEVYTRQQQVVEALEAVRRANATFSSAYPEQVNET